MKYIQAQPRRNTRKGPPGILPSWPPSGWRERLARGERGQSLVEMTIGMVVLLILVSGLLDLGRLYFTYLALEDGAGEAALFLAVYPNCPTSTECADPNNAEWRAANAGGGLVDWSSATVNISPAGPYNLGDTIAVTIAYDYQLLTPVIPDIAGANSLTLTAHATELIIVEP